jgi:hypothetical protein
MDRSVGNLVLENGGQTASIHGTIDTGAPSPLILDTSIAQRLGLPNLGSFSKSWGWGLGPWTYYRTIIDQISMPDSPGCVLKNVYAEYGPYRATFEEDFLLGEGFLRAFPGLSFSILPDGTVKMDCSSLYAAPLVNAWTLGGAVIGFAGAAILLPSLLKRL